VTVKSVLIVGGGVAGMACAIEMRKVGFDVDLIDIDPDWKVYGAGLTTTGPTLRALRTLGVLDEVMKSGGYWTGAKVHDRQGKLLAELPILPLDDGVPATGGIMRPALHKIMSERTQALGAKVRLGVSVADLSQTGDKASVTFTDGSQADYDLVVGADGVYSKMRQRIFPDAPKPTFTGQGCWRLVAEQPQGFDRSFFYFADDMKVGFNPVSPTHMYMFLLQKTPDNPWIPLEEQPQKLYDLMEGFGGITPEVRAGVMTSTSINYRPLEILLLPAPWHLGRVVLIGDAVHATTPHLASGAGMAIEDGVVLAEELAKGGALEDGLKRFEDRRFDRCRLVVENSVKLGELEMNNGDPAEHGRLMSQAIEALRQPI
jgi:2-polyprenyl-6-methoxyphenol hydroxylase-like FAD-dependent oxidoreductase